MASGRNSPSNLLRLQPGNQKVCSSARLHPGWSRKGQGESKGLPGRGGELEEWGRDGVWSQGAPRRDALCFGSALHSVALSGVGYVQAVLPPEQEETCQSMYLIKTPTCNSLTFLG